MAECGFLRLILFLLANADRLSLEIKILNLRAENFAPAGTGTGGEDERRVDKRKAGAFCVDQQSVHLGKRQKQAIP